MLNIFPVSDKLKNCTILDEDIYDLKTLLILLYFKDVKRKYLN